MFILSDQLSFPSVDYANANGLLAIGGDLSTDRLKLAYKSGIFPWYSEGQPISWYSPDPRMILFPDELKVSKSMRQVVRSKRFSITFNQSFEKVISNCKTIDRSLQDQKGTWITEEMKKAYISLYQEGCAKSIEVWENDNLVGGLYGIEVGSVFCGESMFSKVSNASKMALIALSENNNNPYALIDCQVYNDHLSSLGAREISREDFLDFLQF
jgi:leucyl/phenylalanyl-tRNA--protein transferase